MVDKIRLLSTNPITFVDHIFVLFGFMVMKPVVVCSITLIVGMLMNTRSVPADHVPCPDLCIGESLLKYYFFDTPSDVYT